MNVRVHNIYLQSQRVNSSCSFVLISDIHSDEKKLESVYEIIASEIHPSFIAIPGDIYDSEDDSRNTAIKQILNYYDNYYPQFITIGNHDLANYHYQNWRMTEVQSDNYAFFENLGPNTFVFRDNNNGESVDNSNIKIFGMEFPIRWYKENEPEDEFRDKLRNYEFNSDMLNILLFHSPNNFINNNGDLINFNSNGGEVLVLSGHNHGGLVPYPLHSLLPQNRGIVGPYNRILPKYAYGEYKGNNSCLIVSDGITKFHASFGGKVIAPLVERIYVPDIYVINIVPAKSLNDEQHLALRKKETAIYKK